MRVTRLGPSIPILTLTGILSESEGGPSGQVPTANGSNSVAWGSNVANIWSNGSNKLLGPEVNFASGANIIFSVSSNTLTIAAAGGGGGGGSSTAEYVTTATDFALSAETAIPGLAGSPDRIPASPGGSDLEFDTTTIGGTALGAPTTIDADTTVPSHLYIKKTATAAFGLVGRYWAKSPAFTVTAKLTDFTRPAAQFMRVAFGVAEATPGKTEAIYVDGQTPTVVSTISTTSPTAGAAYVTTGSTTWDALESAPIYFRCVVVSSTDITWYYSMGGLHFRRLGTANRNPGFTIGSVFVAVDPEQATYDMEAAFDWIRYT